MGARGFHFSASPRRQQRRIVGLLVSIAILSAGRAGAGTTVAGRAGAGTTVAGRAGAGTTVAAGAVTTPTDRAGTGTAAGPATASSGAVPGRALIRFRPGTAPTTQRTAHLKAGAQVVRRAAGYDVVSFPEQISTDVVLKSYRSDTSVLVAEPDYLAHVALTPGDPCVSGPCAGVANQYALSLTNAFDGWASFPGHTYTAATKPAAVTIAVLDTKVDVTHPDFTNAGGSSSDAADGGQLDLAGARDWIAPSRQSGSAAYHGTYVAGLAAAATGNGLGVASIGYAARVLPLTVVDGSGTADASSLADAIVYAWERGARVINLSLGLSSDSQAVHDAISRVTTGINPALVVAAAGNNTGASAFYPGSYPEVMSVGGTGAQDNHASCANHNANISVSAPAEKVVSLAPGGGQYAAPCGTSAATPQVSALAALLFAQNPARSPAVVRKLIEMTADDLGPVGRDDYFGNGRIDVARALSYGDGAPVTTLARATVPLVPNGGSSISALATSAAGVKAGELRIDSPDAAPIKMEAADHVFGGTSESLASNVDAARLAAGPHPIWVRASDGTHWGPSTVGVMIVDRTAPSLASLAATNGVRAAGQPVSITFTSWDALSPTLTYAIQISNAADHSTVFRDVRRGVGAGQQRYDWTPGPEVLPGKYDIKLAVADQAGNRTQQLTSAVVT